MIVLHTVVKKAKVELNYKYCIEALGVTSFKIKNFEKWCVLSDPITGTGTCDRIAE